MNPPVTLTLHLPALAIPTKTAQVLAENLTDWTIDPKFPGEPSPAHLLQIADRLETKHRLCWRTQAKKSPEEKPSPSLGEGWVRARGHRYSLPTPFGCKMSQRRAGRPSPYDGSGLSGRGSAPEPYSWPDSPRILALIPHWCCEPWLGRAIASLLAQSHPLTQIAVIDDASPEPPLEIVKACPEVTLLQAAERVGPYRLIQSVIDRTDYDAYLFQDADDWSSYDRLATLLQTARNHGAELVGSQEIRVLEDSALEHFALEHSASDNPAQLQAVGYPLEVNLALSQAPGHALLHPTSLVTRSLVQRLGGFATGLRFGGDTEFLLRAHWQARIVNSPGFCYFRRKRPDSLTTDPVTGLDSPARQALTQQMKQRAIAHAEAFAQGQPLDLRPMQTEGAIALKHCWGPELAGL
ncbi:MAG: glycosyltransferase family 2 protein [Spirulinaceae cyanobacterium]